MVRSMVADESFNHIAIVPLDAPEGPRFVTPLSCERVFYAGTRGVCLTIGLDGMTTTYTAEVFDEQFASIGRVPLTGVPSRVRVSPDGRRAGITVFETGHSYSEAGTHPHHNHRHRIGADPRSSRSVRRDARRAPSAPWTSTSGASRCARQQSLLRDARHRRREAPGRRRRGRAHRPRAGAPTSSARRCRRTTPASPTRRRSPTSAASAGTCTCWTCARYRHGARRRDAERGRSGRVAGRWPRDVSPDRSRGADIWVLSTNAPEPPRILVPLAYLPPSSAEPPRPSLLPCPHPSRDMAGLVPPTRARRQAHCYLLSPSVRQRW